jgi:glycosyltransferase involved in cell wall biosynthesis
MLKPLNTHVLQVADPVETKAPYTVLLYYPDFGATGGIERFVVNLSLGLQRRGQFRPVVVCSADTPFYQMLQQAGIEVRGVRTFASFVKPGWRWLDVLSLAQLKLIIEELNPQIIHVHIGQLENVWLRCLGAFNRQKQGKIPQATKLVYSFHGYGTLYSVAVANPLKRFFKQALRPLFRVTASQMQQLVFVSHFEQQRMLSEGYLSKTTCPMQVIHNAIDARDWQQRMQRQDRAKICQQYHLPVDAECISFINRLDANKDPLGFIQWAEAFEREYPLPAEPVGTQNLTNQNPTSAKRFYLMAGDGPLAGDAVRAISLSPICQQFRFLGFQSDVAPVLAITDVAVFIPRQEGFGIGILECLTCGVPVAAPAVGGIPEMFSPEFSPQLASLCLYAPQDMQALTLCVKRWLATSPAERLPWQQQLQQAASRFDTETFLDNFTEAYLSTL